jgi:hypothetical protein
MRRTTGNRRDLGPRSALTRRAFLATSAGLLVAAACGGGRRDAASTGIHPKGVDAGTLSMEPYVSTGPERLAFALLDDRGRYIGGAPATIQLEPPGAAPRATVPMTLHAEGLPAGRGVYAVDVPLPAPGVWSATIRLEGRDPTSAHFQVTTTPQVPVPGATAPSVPSPTVDHPLGVDPLCTREPACPLHRTSLADALRAGRPTAVMFATPARCQSRYCGPVLDQLLAIRRDYEQRVALIHVEIYQNATTSELVSTVQRWNLPGEPWLFGIDRTGRIAGRLDGAMGTDEVRTLLDRIA